MWVPARRLSRQTSRALLRRTRGKFSPKCTRFRFTVEDYTIDNDGEYAAAIDPTHVADRLPSTFENPFSGFPGQDVAWEDRETCAVPASPVAGIASYADSASVWYNFKGYGRWSAITIVLSGGR